MDNVILNLCEQKRMWGRLQEHQVKKGDMGLSLHSPSGMPCCPAPRTILNCPVLHRAKLCFKQRMRVAYFWFYPHASKDQNHLVKVMDAMWSYFSNQEKEMIYFDNSQLFNYKILSAIAKFPPGTFEKYVKLKNNVKLYKKPKISKTNRKDLLSHETFCANGASILYCFEAR